MSGNPEWVVIINGPHKNRVAKVHSSTTEMFYLQLAAGREAALFPRRDVRVATPEEIERLGSTRRFASYGSVRDLYRRKDDKDLADAAASLGFLKLSQVQAALVEEMTRRHDELLASNNQLLERARKAERERDELRAELDGYKFRPEIGSTTDGL